MEPNRENNPVPNNSQSGPPKNGQEARLQEECERLRQRLAELEAERDHERAHLAELDAEVNRWRAGAAIAARQAFKDLPMPTEEEVKQMIEQDDWLPLEAFIEDLERGTRES